MDRDMSYKNKLTLQTYGKSRIYKQRKKFLILYLYCETSFRADSMKRNEKTHESHIG